MPKTSEPDALSAGQTPESLYTSALEVKALNRPLQNRESKVNRTRIVFALIGWMRFWVAFSRVFKRHAWQSGFIRVGALTSLLALGLGVVSGDAAEPRLAESAFDVVDLSRLSLEDLGNISVTSVSRKSESLSGAAAAIHVITGEDIRRSGVTLLPEALRMAPGLDVARANSHQWAISSRGFNEVSANALLVLVDGRTIYTPSFSGVFWEETDTVLEDVDRIEVIRGPGATLWGANAVNGVINIITKSAKETQGVLVSAGGGLEERAFGTVRYGGQLKSNVHYRVYGKYSNRDDFTISDGSEANDQWWTSQWGFRIDSEISEATRWTLQGDSYVGNWDGTIRRHTLSPPGMFSDRFRANSEGANVLGRWSREFSEDSDLSVQVYYDRTDREYGITDEIRNTADMDLQYRFPLGERHEFVWGGGYRYSVDEVTESADFAADDPSLGLQLFSAFVQDEVALIPDRLRLTIGAKVEHHDFTGFELQPNGRIAWTPDDRKMLWAAVSRAVRTPSRAERGFRFFSEIPYSTPSFPLPVLVPAHGNPNFDSEELLGFEIGGRISPHSRVAFDVATFYNVYDRLFNVVQLPVEILFSPSSEAYISAPVTDDNALSGETYGAEISVTLQPADVWRLRANYTFLRMNLHTGSPIPSFSEESVGDSPRHQVSLWSDIELGRDVEWGLGLRYVDELASQPVRAYTELETRLAWRPTQNCEISIVGRNLLDSHHQEFAPFLFSRRDVEVDRAIFGKVTLRF